MITVEDARRAWETKEPVEYHHPLAIRPIVCTVGGIVIHKRINRIARITLIQQPGNSFIVTRPEYVTLAHKRSPELEKALALLAEIPKEDKQ